MNKDDIKFQKLIELRKKLHGFRTILNKEICIECINKNRFNPFLPDDLLPWCEGDEKRWDEHNMVQCSISTVGDIHVFIDGPPKECSYVLEHMVNNVEKGK